MSDIYLKLDNEVATITKADTIASGDVDTVNVNIEFSDEWNDFPIKTMCVHTITYDEKVLGTNFVGISSEGIAVIPQKTLSKAGKLFMSVIGETTDKKVLTSTWAILTIRNGANCEVSYDEVDVLGRLLPAGGNGGDFLVKASDEDYDYSWGTPDTFIDTEMSDESQHAVENRVIKAYVDKSGNCVSPIYDLTRMTCTETYARLKTAIAENKTIFPAIRTSDKKVIYGIGDVVENTDRELKLFCVTSENGKVYMPITIYHNADDVIIRKDGVGREIQNLMAGDYVEIKNEEVSVKAVTKSNELYGVKDKLATADAIYGLVQATKANIENNLGPRIAGKQDKLTAGDNITISENNVISADVPEVDSDAFFVTYTCTTNATGEIDQDKNTRDKSFEELYDAIANNKTIYFTVITKTVWGTEEIKTYCSDYYNQTKQMQDIISLYGSSVTAGTTATVNSIEKMTIDNYHNGDSDVIGIHKKK